MNLRAERVVLFIPVAVAALLAVFPVTYLVFGAFWSQPPGFPGQATLANFMAVFSDPDIFPAIANSLSYSAGAAILATTIALFLAVAVIKTDAPLKRVVSYTLLVSLAIPWMVEDMSWTYLLSPRTGVYNLWLSDLTGLGTSLLNIYSVWGLAWVMGLSLTPLAYLMISPSLSFVDPNLEDASRVSGADVRRTFMKVDLPLVRPAVLSSILLCFVIAMEAFDAGAIIGIPGRVPLLTTSIYGALQGFTPDPNLASAYALLLVALTVVSMAMYLRSVRTSARYQTISGRSGRPRPLRLGQWRWLVGGAFVVYLVGYPIPVLGTLVFVSLHVYWNPTSLPPLTLQNYSELLEFPSLTGGVFNSIAVSGASAAAAVTLSSFLAYAGSKGMGKLTKGAEFIAFLPLAFPTMVLGVGLLWALAYSPVPIYGTVWALVLAYTVRYVPIASRFLAGPVLQVGRELEEMSRICGANSLQSLQRIFLPVLRPALLTSILYVFIVSVKDLGAAVMLITSNSTLFSAALYTIWSTGELLQAAAGGVVYVVVLSGILGFSALVLKVDLFAVLGSERRVSRPYPKTSSA